IPSGEEEAPEQRLGVRPSEAGHRLHALEDGATRVELHLLLREVADLHAVPDTDTFAPHQPLEQGRLAGAVRADERDVLAPLDREGRVAQQDTAADRDLEPFRLHDRAAAARRLQELEAQAARAAGEEGHLTGRGSALLLEPADLGQLRLRLLRLVLLGPEPLDEPLEPSDVGLDA